MKPAKEPSYFTTYTRNRTNRHPRTTAAGIPGAKATFSFSSMISRPQMPSVFNIIRACVYTAVLFWTIICLAIAIHFYQLLTTNDLTRFIPFAIFVCSATLAIIPALLLFGMRRANPISTRIELGCLGLAGVIWLVLVAFLFSTNAADAGVECFSSGSTTLVEVPGFSTEAYQAQYRVIEAFSVLNVILIWGFLSFLLFLAMRYHLRGDRQVWYTPVTLYPWFYRPKSQEKEPKLPPPVTAPVDRSKSKGAGALTEVKEKSHDRHAKGRESSRGRQPQSQTRYAYKHGYWLPEAPPVPPKTGRETTGRREKRDRNDKYLRDASPRR